MRFMAWRMVSSPTLLGKPIRSELSAAGSFYILAVMTFRCALLLFAVGSIIPSFSQVTGTGPADDPTRQTDADWIDNRWSKTEIGQFLHAKADPAPRRTSGSVAAERVTGPTTSAPGERTVGS